MMMFELDKSISGSSYEQNESDDDDNEGVAMIDYCIKLSDQENLLSLTKEIASEEEEYDGRSMIVALIHMAIAGHFICALKEIENSNVKSILDKIDDDVLVVETIIYVALSVSRLRKIDKESKISVLRPDAGDYIIGADRVILDTIVQLAEFDAKILSIHRKRKYIEVMRNNRDVSEEFSRILYLSSGNNSLSEQLSLNEDLEGDDSQVDEFIDSIKSYISDIPQGHIRALNIILGSSREEKSKISPDADAPTGGPRKDPSSGRSVG